MHLCLAIEEDRTGRGGKGNTAQHALRGVEVSFSLSALNPQFSSTVVRKPQKQTGVKLRIPPVNVRLCAIVKANSDSSPAVLGAD